VGVHTGLRSANSRLRILLYLPFLKANTTKAIGYAAIARSVSRILYTYVDLAAANNLNPSWPQLQRLVICGQILIMCHAAGELQKRESRVLFRMLVDILRKHEDTWPVCSELVNGYSAAAHVFGAYIAGAEMRFVLPLMGTGIDVSPAPSALRIHSELNLGDMTSLESFQWTDLGLDFDFSSFPL
jgi:hypothetical protein